MQAFIKTAAAFRTAYVRDVLDYELTLESLESLPSSVTLLGGDIPREMGGSWLYVADSLFLIGAVSPGEGMTELQLQSPLDAFSRPRAYVPPAAGSTLGAFVARELAEGWRDQADAVYALPYLQIAAADSLPFVPPETDEQGFYTLSAWLRILRRDCGLELRFTPAGDKLGVRILNAVPRSHTFLCGDGHTELASNAYSRTAVAKVTTVQPVETGELDAEGQKIFETVTTDWYLGADGSVGSQEPAGRASGSWSVIPVSAKNDAEEAARAAFSKNSETHKVEFYTDFRPALLDPFRLRLPSGAVFAGQIQAVRKLRGDRRWLCQSGTWPVSLTDKVRSAGGGTGGSSRGSSGSAQAYAVGDVYITTRDGDPAALLGYGAWSRVESCYLYCAGGSVPVRSTGGSATHTLTAAELPADVSILDTSQIMLPVQGTPSGSAQFPLLSRTATLPTTPLGQGSPFALNPKFFAVNVWLRIA